MSRFSFCGLLAGLFLFSTDAGSAGKPQRIVSMNFCADELALLLADPETVRAVTAYPHRSEIREILKRYPHIEKTHGTFEEVMVHEPDLVLAGRFSPRETVRLLVRRKVRVFIVEVPETIEDIGRIVRETALHLGAAEKGDALIREMRERLNQIQNRDAIRPRVLVWGPGGHVPGSGTFEDEVLRAAGAENLAAILGIRGHSWLSVEDIIHAQPDTLILSGGHEGKNSLSSQMLFHPAVHRGLQNVKIISLPPDSLRCGSPLTIQIIEWMADKIS